MPTAVEPLILAIDQGTTNSKAILISSNGQLRASGSARVGIASPQPGWVEQDADRIRLSVLEAVAACRSNAPDAEIAGIVQGYDRSLREIQAA